MKIPRWSFALAAIVGVAHKSSDVSALTFSPKTPKSCSFSASPTSRCVSPKKMMNSYVDALESRRVDDRNENVDTSYSFTTYSSPNPTSRYASQQKMMNSYIDSLESRRPDDRNENAGSSYSYTPPAAIETPAVTEVPVGATNVRMGVPTVSLGSVGSNVTPQELTLEEELTAALSSTSRNIFGHKSSGVYINVRETLRDTKARSQRRISRTDYEKEKASEKIARLEAKIKAEKLQIRTELNEKIEEAQAKIEQEMQSLTASLEFEIKMEARRQSEISGLLSTLTYAKYTLLTEIASEEAITAEMQTVRSKLKPGTIASQLQTILERKIKVTSIDRQLVDDLTACVMELESIYKESQNRASKMENTLRNFVLPDVKTGVIAEWSSIEAMEQMLEEAAEDAYVCQAKISSICDQINGALVAKNTVLGLDVPASLTKVAQKLRGKQNVAALTGTEATAIAPVVGLSDLQNSPDEEVLSVLSKSASTAALSGGKTVIYGLKSILDSVTDNQVAAATSSAIEKSSGIAKGLTNISLAAQGKTGGGVANTIDNIKDLAQGEEVKSTFRSTVETLGALGQAGKAIANGIWDTESTMQSTQAAKEAGQSLWTAASAVAVLGSKQVAKLKERADD